MELDPATVATAAASAYFRQALYGTSEPAADRHVVGLLGALGRSDPRTWAALTALRANPDDPVATAALEQRVAEVARRDPSFDAALARTLRGDKPRRWWLW
jgi:transcriptional regulator GlxA family with amidase domain